MKKRLRKKLEKCNYCGAPTSKYKFYIIKDLRYAGNILYSNVCRKPECIDDYYANRSCGYWEYCDHTPYNGEIGSEYFLTDIDGNEI